MPCTLGSHKVCENIFQGLGQEENPTQHNFITSAASFNCKSTFDPFSLVYIEHYDCFRMASPKHMNVYIRGLGKQARQVF